MVFKTWEEVQAFKDICNIYETIEDINSFISHFGVLDVEKVNLNNPRRDEDWNSFERIIQCQYVLERLFQDEQAADKFFKNNCVGNKEPIPTYVSTLMVFVTMEFIVQNGEYYLTVLDTCLSENDKVVSKLFWPITVVGQSPEAFHGDNLVNGVYSHKISGSSFKLIDERSALKMLLVAVRSKSKYCGTLVLFNRYLSCPALLCCVRRHGLEKMFYTTFSSVLEVRDLVQPCSGVQYPSLNQAELYKVHYNLISFPIPILLNLDFFPRYSSHQQSI